MYLVEACFMYSDIVLCAHIYSYEIYFNSSLMQQQ